MLLAEVLLAGRNFSWDKSDKQALNAKAQPVLFLLPLTGAEGGVWLTGTIQKVLAKAIYLCFPLLFAHTKQTVFTEFSGNKDLSQSVMLVNSYLKWWSKLCSEKSLPLTDTLHSHWSSKKHHCVLGKTLSSSKTEKTHFFFLSFRGFQNTRVFDELPRKTDSLD